MKKTTLIFLGFLVVFALGCAKEEIQEQVDLVETESDLTRFSNCDFCWAHDGPNNDIKGGYDGSAYWHLYKEKQGGWAFMDFTKSQDQNYFEMAAGNKNSWDDWWYLKDAVGGKGWDYGYGRTIKYNYNAEGNYDFVGVYGWAKNPCIEYYVVENENGYGIQGTYRGEYTVDGVTYYLYKQYQNTSKNPCDGWGSFWQYIAKRKDGVDHGNWAPMNQDMSIDMQKHINHWNYIERGDGSNDLGNWGYQVFGMEVFKGKYAKLRASVWE